MMKFGKLLATATLLVCAFSAKAQYNMPTQTYTFDKPYKVEKIAPPKGKKVKNVILMIGDGMSLMHVYTAWTCNRGQLWLENAQYTGLSKTKIYRQPGTFIHPLYLLMLSATAMNRKPMGRCFLCSTSASIYIQKRMIGYCTGSHNFLSLIHFSYILMSSCRFNSLIFTLHQRIVACV